MMGELVDHGDPDLVGKVVRIGEVLLERQAEYWKSTLSGIPEVLELPADHARPFEQDHRGAFAEFSLNESLTSELRQLARDHGAEALTGAARRRSRTLW